MNRMVQDIVQEVMAKMQITSDVSGNHGVFKDMNEAIVAAKKTQKIVGKNVHGPERKDHIQYPYKDQRECGDHGTDGEYRRPAWEMWDIRSSSMYWLLKRLPNRGYYDNRMVGTVG